jgi:15-cis-phytoene synthase
MKEIFDNLSLRCSRLATQAYSNSFSIGILCLDKKLRDPVYSIYGFVRFADEIVDSFEGFNKTSLLSKFKEDTFCAIQDKVSINPILNSFQATVNKFEIDNSLIALFLKSMDMDLNRKLYDEESLKQYILGSAEVVGLMCLKVFTHTNLDLYEKLKPYAMSLGAAFQKINFLRDLRADFINLGRSYFPGVEVSRLDEHSKKSIEHSIEHDFREGYKGIKLLPHGSRFGVYVAYVYYLALFRKIKNTPSDQVLKSRISIRKRQKATLLAYSFVKHQLNMM